MNSLVSCPKCARALGRFTADGWFRAQCTSCQVSYEGVFGRLSDWVSRKEPLWYLSPRLPKLYRRRYRGRLTTPGRELKQLTFSVPDTAQVLPIRPGDRISILYSTRGQNLEALFALHNHSIGKRCLLPTPVPGKTRQGQAGGVSMAIGVGALLGGINVGWVLLVGLAVLLGSRLFHVAELTSPMPDGDRPTEARLMDELKLVNQKTALHEHMQTLRQESQDNAVLIRQLQALRSKMMRFNPSLYAPRVSSIETAMRLLNQRIAHNHRLVEAYEQTVGMIDIELEASSLGDQLPDVEDFTRHIFLRLDELNAIEAQNQDRWDQIQAIDEVRRLQA
ncbi:MAG: hypothetical protein KME20_16710 [Kaiparowitsia implicata GSE-PSE-MK54-09C]|nr:hypothetical protein [Kaiparowitsia implicata GSE-PSE-MK54-09C]